MACRRIPLPHPLSLLLAASFAACASGPSTIDTQLLTPPGTTLAEPADFGLAAEPFEIVLHSSASLTGWWIPHENGQKRTVVLFHDADTDTGVAHPWYRFLHAAGFQVLAFDPRGYGRSKGTPTLQAWIYDLPELFDWLRERPDVDPQRIALFGTGLGSVAALWAARTQGCQALVLEHLPSLLDILRESQGADGSALSAFEVGFAEAVHLPAESEPDENAPRVKAPALFLASDGEPARDRKALARAYGLYAGEKQLWLLAGTGRSPHGLLTHDGEYQQRITSFLAGALDGAPPVLATAAKKLGSPRDGVARWQIGVQRPGRPFAPGERQAIEVCALLADGSAHFARAWSGDGEVRVRLDLPGDPVCTTAVVVPGAVEDAEAVFRRVPSALTRSGASVAALWLRIDALREGKLAPPEQRQLRLDLAAAEAASPWHPVLAAELADVFALLGKELFASADPAEHELGRQLLQRAVASAPAKPDLHLWPGPLATYGYPHEAAIATARALLAAPAK